MRLKTSDLASSPLSTMTTSKFRSRKRVASASRSTSCLTSIPNLLLTIIANATIEGTTLVAQTIPEDMADTKEQVTAWMNLQQVNRVLEGLLERRVKEVAELSLPEYQALFRLQIASGHP